MTTSHDAIPDLLRDGEPTEADSAERTNPFAIAPAYRAAGWTDTLPGPFGQKKEPPKGFTGYGGRAVSDRDVERWLRDPTPQNLFIRAPLRVVGLDKDCYDGKRGGDTIRDLEKDLGPLPLTWMSTSRRDGSGIMWFRTRASTETYPSQAGPDVEVIRRSHRYAVVWPSQHPDGPTYGWWTPDGDLVERVPPIDELPFLPDKWEQYLANGYETNGQRVKPGTRAEERERHRQARRWLKEHVRAGEPCQYVAQLIADGVASARREKGDAYDNTRDWTLAALRAAEAGHRGVRLALTQVKEEYVATVQQKRGGAPVAGAEFDRFTLGGAVKILGDPSENAKSTSGCACEGAPDGLDAGPTDFAERKRIEAAARGMFDSGSTLSDTLDAMQRESPDIPVRMIEDVVLGVRPQVKKSERAETWPKPREIPTGLRPVAPFDFALLPAVLRDWIADVADRAATPPDFAAVAVMIGAASLIGRRVTVRPHPKDNWTVIPHLWGAAVGRSGLLKSPTIKEALKPLKRLEISASSAYEDQQNQYLAELAVAKAMRTPSRKYLEQQRIAGRSSEDIARQLIEEHPDPRKPPRQRYLVNDTTYERLGEILQDNPNGTLIYRDELVGLLKQLDKDGQETARAFYLEAWSGDGRYEFNRITRDNTIIPNCGFSLFGSIQPGPLRRYLRGALAGEEAADGLVQRFQLAVWPDAGGNWRYVDRYPDTDAQARAFDALQALVDRDPSDLDGYHDTFDPDGPPYLRLTAEAHEVFLDWRSQLEDRVRGGGEHPALESHFAKYRSLVPSVALTSHLVDGNAGDVDLTALVRAIAWAEYLESHARRLYGAVMTADTFPAQMLARRVLAGEVADGFTVRDIYRSCWTGLGTKDEVESAVDLLVALGWLREEEVQPGEKGGRPKAQHRINPRLDELVHQAEERAMETIEESIDDV